MGVCPADRALPDGRLPPPIGCPPRMGVGPSRSNGFTIRSMPTPARAHANEKRRPRRVAFRFWHRSEKPTEGNRG